MASRPVSRYNLADSHQWLTGSIKIRTASGPELQAKKTSASVHRLPGLPEPNRLLTHNSQWLSQYYWPNRGIRFQSNSLSNYLGHPVGAYYSKININNSLSVWKLPTVGQGHAFSRPLKQQNGNAIDAKIVMNSMTWSYERQNEKKRSRIHPKSTAHLATLDGEKLPKKASLRRSWFWNMLS